MAQSDRRAVPDLAVRRRRPRHARDRGALEDRLADHLPRLGRVALRRSTLGTAPREETPAVASYLYARGLRLSDGLVPRLRRRTGPRCLPDRHGPRGRRSPRWRHAPYPANVRRTSPVDPTAF